MSKFSRLLCVFLLLACTSTYAQDNQQLVLKSWYQALSPVDHPIDRKVISNLLTSDAMVELKDYDIVQSKSEFIDSLDSWEDAIDGGSIRYKVKDIISDEAITASVCYTFSSNELMTEEIFKFSDGKIMNSIQVTIAEDCTNF